MKILRLLILPLLILTQLSCEETLDYYIGMGQQPEFTEEGITDGVNLFGILRPDTLAGANRSFFFVQRIWPATDWLNAFRILPDAQVHVYLSENSGFDTIRFPLVIPDSVHYYDSLYRPVESFLPVPGRRYQVECRLPGGERASGSTVFPPAPDIVEQSISVSSGNLQFTISGDSLIKLLDVYVLSDQGSILIGRLLPTGSQDIQAVLALPPGLVPEKLTIFAYDANLALYYGSTNTSLNFNKYRTPFSTLDEGYGVFGSLNVKELNLTE